MKPPPYLVELVKRAEKLERIAYLDDVGVWTIGWGHTGGVQPYQEITESEAEAFLAADLEIARQRLSAIVTVPLTEHQHAALWSFTFNLGSRPRATLFRLLNAGDYEGAAGEFENWRKGGGRVLSGLVKRRGWEEQLFRQTRMVLPDGP